MTVLTSKVYSGVISIHIACLHFALFTSVQSHVNPVNMRRSSSILSGAEQQRRHIRLPNELYWETTKWMRLQHYFRIRKIGEAKMFVIGTFGAYLQQQCQKLSSILWKLPNMQIWYQLLGPDGSHYRGSDPSPVIIPTGSNIGVFQTAVYNKESALLRTVDPSKFEVYSNDEALELLAPERVVYGHGATLDSALMVIVYAPPATSAFDNSFSTIAQTIVPSKVDMVKRVKQFVYYDTFGSGEIKNCVTPITATLAITFKHGSHMKIRLGQHLKITQEANPEQQVDVICTHIAKRDFILYSRIEGEFVHPVYETEIREGQTYILCGFPKGHPSSQSVSGYVSAVECRFSGHLIGHGGAVMGYSGGPAFCDRTGRLIAMSVEGDWGNIAESTINKMIPINSVASDVDYAEAEFSEWTGPKYTAKREEIVKFLCSLNREQATEMANGLLKQGIEMSFIKEKLSTFGAQMDWCKIELLKAMHDSIGMLINEESGNSGAPPASSSQGDLSAPLVEEFSPTLGENLNFGGEDEFEGDQYLLGYPQSMSTVQVEQRLRTQFPAENDSINVEDVSAGQGTKFRIRIKSTQMAGKAKEERRNMINGCFRAG